MELIMWIFSICATMAVTSAVRCGPNTLCSCYTDYDSNMMDCRKTALAMTQICSSIAVENDTIFITGIDASWNNIVTLNRSSLDGCENVTVLVLVANGLADLHEDTFRDLTNLTRLDLSDNNLTSVYYDVDKPVLSNIKTLQTLSLHGNYKLVPDKNYAYPLLSNLTALKTLTMDGLFNTSFRKEYILLQSLVSLNLSGTIGVCDIRHLENNTFLNTPGLQTLDVSNCNLTTIDAGTFEHLNKLRWLDLSLNRQLGFRVVRNASYGLQFTQIDYVNYSATQNTFGLGTEVKVRDMCFLHNTTLRSLSINSNKINLFEANLLLLLPSTLQELHADDNRFTFGPYLFQCGCASNLTHFLASYQDRMHLPGDYVHDMPVPPVTSIPLQEDCPFMLESYLRNISKTRPNCPYISKSQKKFGPVALPPNLKHGDFSDSNLQYEIPRIPIVPFTNNVEYIDLSRNILYSWKGPIGPFPALKTLNLSRNYCNYIGEDFFTYVSSLETLDISRNFFGVSISQDKNGKLFQHLRSLRNLYATGNQIKQIPSNIFDSLINLEVLDLSNNIIDEFEVSFDNLRNLSYLDLSTNALRSLSRELVMHFEHLYTRRNISFSINLQNNRIRCTCTDQVFLRWMVKRRHLFVNFNEYIFTDATGKTIPLSVFLKTVSNFDKQCHSYTYLLVVCTLSLSVFLSVIVSGIIYKNRWKLRYFIYMNKRRFYGYQRLPNEDPLENYKHDAFISYSDENIGFVLKEIIPNLEDGAEGLSLCIHQRDFMPGNAIADNIIGAIQSSRKTVVLLTNSFIKRKWCLYEFHMARMESIYSRAENGCLVVVMLEKVPTKNMPLEMMQWIKDESYIEFTNDVEGYRLFWANLRAAIVDSRSF